MHTPCARRPRLHMPTHPQPQASSRETLVSHSQLRNSTMHPNSQPRAQEAAAAEHGSRPRRDYSQTRSGIPCPGQTVLAVQSMYEPLPSHTQPCTQTIHQHSCGSRGSRPRPPCSLTPPGMLLPCLTERGFRSTFSLPQSHMLQYSRQSSQSTPHSQGSCRHLGCTQLSPRRSPRSSCRGQMPRW
jgi:hypothetical protein